MLEKMDVLYTILVELSVGYVIEIINWDAFTFISSLFNRFLHVIGYCMRMFVFVFMQRT